MAAATWFFFLNTGLGKVPLLISFLRKQVWLKQHQILKDQTKLMEARNLLLIPST